MSARPLGRQGRAHAVPRDELVARAHRGRMAQAPRHTAAVSLRAESADDFALARGRPARERRARALVPPPSEPAQLPFRPAAFLDMPAHL